MVIAKCSVMPVNPNLVREKQKAVSEIKREIAATMTAITLLSIRYRYLGYGFSFSSIPTLQEDVQQELAELRLRLKDLIRQRGDIMADISQAENLVKYGIDKRMTTSEIDEFLSGKIEGKTTEARISGYVGQLKGEMESFIAVGLVAGLSQTKIGQSFMAALTHPYGDASVVKAMVSGLFDAVRLRRGELKYGRGRYASAYSNLLRLDYSTAQEIYTRNTILGFMTQKKIAGIIPRRNSSIPCWACDSVAGRVYAVDSGILPVHPRCICFAEPCLADGSEFSKDDI